MLILIDVQYFQSVFLAFKKVQMVKITSHQVSTPGNNPPTAKSPGLNKFKICVHIKYFCMHERAQNSRYRLVYIV